MEFELKKDEITIDAYNEVQRLVKKTEYVPVEIVLEMLKEYKNILDYYGTSADNWIFISEAIQLTGKRASSIYRLIDNGKIRAIGQKYRLKVNKKEVMEYFKNER